MILENNNKIILFLYRKINLLYLLLAVIFSMPMILTGVKSLSLILFSLLFLFYSIYNDCWIFEKENIKKETRLFLIPLYIKKYKASEVSNFTFELFQKGKVEIVDGKKLFFKMSFLLLKKEEITIFVSRFKRSSKYYNYIEKIAYFYNIELKKIN